MRVAALYDVHGNLPALEAVLADVARASVDAIVFGGDIAAGPMPRETITLVRSLDAQCIRGNADRRDARTPLADQLWQELPAEAADWLNALPPTLVLGDVLFCHATPRSDEEIVTPGTPEERLAQIVAGVEQSVVVVGHTHMQQDRRVGSVRWINAGSVGMPYEDEPGTYACWAIVGDDVELRRTPYDRSPLGDYEFPRSTRAEATAYFESLVR